MLVGYLQSRDRRYIMKSFFLEVNENIETHVAKEKKKQNKKQNHNKQFVSLIDKNLVFVRVHRNEHFGYDMFVSTSRTTRTNEEHS